MSSYRIASSLSPHFGHCTRPNVAKSERWGNGDFASRKAFASTTTMPTLRAMGCLFCKVVAREIPSDIVFENTTVLAFRDIRPVAPTHVLVIPKEHVVGIRDATGDHRELLAELLLGARDVAEALGIGDDGYRLVINQGDNAGQSVHHLHVHVLGGRGLKWPPG